MVLGRSNSGPGGLSINTSSANSLFGSTTSSQALQSSTLFGASTKPAMSLFGASSTTQSQPAGSLFGASATPASTSQASGSLFGAVPTTSQPAAQPSGGLFGASSTAQPTGGLFGSLNTTSQPAKPSLFGAAPAQQPTTSLFGGSLQPPAQPQQTTSLFGSSLQQPQAQQPQQGGLFSSLGASAAKPSMFAQTAPVPAQGPSLRFGGGPAQTPVPNTSMPTVPAVRIDASNMRSTTRFAELTEAAANEITALQQFIDTSINQSQEIAAILPQQANKISSISPDVAYLQRRGEITAHALENDTVAIDRARVAHTQDLADARLSVEALRRLNLPPGYSSSANDGSMDPRSVVDLFAARADVMKETLEAYKARLTEVEDHVRGMEATLGAAVVGRKGSIGPGEAVRQLGGALRDFEVGIMGVASKVGNVREVVQALELSSSA